MHDGARAGGARKSRAELVDSLLCWNHFPDIRHIYIYRSKLEWLISGVSLARQSLFQSHGLFGIDELIEASWIPTGSDPNSGTTELERSLAAVPAPLVSHDWH